MSEDTSIIADSLDEQERAILEEMAEMSKVEREKFEKALGYFRKNGIYKGNFETSVKEWLDDMENQHIGYVNAVHVPEEKNTGFRWSPTGRFFRITEESAKEHPDLRRLLFTEQVEDVDEDASFTYLVHQWCYFDVEKNNFRSFRVFTLI